MRPTLIDRVEAGHVRLLDDPQYMRLFTAVWDKEAVEGSLQADNLAAANMIRTRSRKNSPLRKLRLSDIAKLLLVVARRYARGKSTK